NGPSRALASLLGVQPSDDLRPLGSRFYAHEPALAVETEDPLEPGQVEQQSIARELLAAHRMTAPAHGERKPFASRAQNGRAHLLDAARAKDLAHAREVQLRLHVVDFGHGELRTRDSPPRSGARPTEPARRT